MTFPNVEPPAHHVDSLVWSGPVGFQPSGFCLVRVHQDVDAEQKKREDHYLIAIIDLLMLS